MQAVENNSVAAGDPFAFAGHKKKHQDLERVDGVMRRTYPELLAAMHEEEVKLGQHLANSELDTFARRFYAEEYRQDLRSLMAMGVEEPDTESERSQAR
jgi:hypothetical protein